MQKEKVVLRAALPVLVLAAVISGMGGFVYETVFYRLALGHFVKRGSTFGPWIPIYAVGAVGILAVTWRARKHPWAVFLLSCIVTGALEFFTGLVLYRAFGLRLWDYNTEPLSFGNLGGYICLRSVLLFGLFGLLLVYGVVPLVLWVRSRLSAAVFRALSFLLGLIFVADIIAHLALRGL